MARKAKRLIKIVLQELTPGLDLTDPVTDPNTKATSRKLTGNIGPATRKAVEEAVRRGIIADVNNLMVDKRKDFMNDVAKNDATQVGNLNGWLPRAESFRMP